MKKRMVGVISDTHGLLRPEAVEALRGCELILHAGDVGKPEILERLRQIAPVVAVRGNVDHGSWAEALPWTEVVEWNDLLMYLLHDRDGLDIDPAAADIRVVIFGHTHRPYQEEHNGVLYLNPGSAGPPRYGLPPTVARLWRTKEKVMAEIVPLTAT